MDIVLKIDSVLAPIVGTVLMLPQLIRIIRTKQIVGLSDGMLWMYFLNCVLWLIQGLLLPNWPLIICNGIALIISIIQIFLKRKYHRLAPKMP